MALVKQKPTSPGRRAVVKLINKDFPYLQECSFLRPEQEPWWIPLCIWFLKVL